METITIENGLYLNYANAIIQDSLGFIWMGSDFGLQKYDGYSYTPYLHNSADSSSLGSNSIFNLCIDSEKNLWIFTRGGLER